VVFGPSFVSVALVLIRLVACSGKASEPLYAFRKEQRVKSGKFSSSKQSWARSVVGRAGASPFKLLTLMEPPDRRRLSRGITKGRHHESLREPEAGHDRLQKSVKAPKARLRVGREETPQVSTWKVLDSLHWTTKKGISRIASSVADRSKKILKQRGVREMDVHVVSCEARPDRASRSSRTGYLRPNTRR
jgi:hypothetical protein